MILIIDNMDDTPGPVLTSFNRRPSCEVGVVIILTLQVGKLELRKVSECV